MNITSRSIRLALASLVIASSALAQAPASPKIDFPAASPKGTLKQRVGLTDIEIVYGRPGAKGRKIFGSLEPYGAVWRTGADSPTKITFSTPVTFGGKQVPAGSYGLYSIPGEKEWAVILNKIEAKDWGAYNYKAENDAARVTVKPAKLDDVVETFTIDLGDIRTESATLNLSWEKTRVSVPMQFDVVATLKPQIEAMMASSEPKKAGQYFQAGMFYFENNVDLKQAAAWLDEGLKLQPEAFYMVYRKGLILEKMGDKQGALAAAMASKEAALKHEWPSLRDEYVRLNDLLIARLK